jgi:outer membrane lipoprotein-sorting protein
MRPLSIYILSLLAILPLSGVSQDTPENPEKEGLAIAQEASRRNEGFGDSTVVLKMELFSADGRRRVRRLTWKTLESVQPDQGDKSLTIFHEPRDIAGTGFLSHTHISQLDDQWLYLPSLKRVKRISSANKSSAFVGSEFSYEDLLSDEVEKFSYRWLKNEECGEWVCSAIERVPLYEGSGYSRQIVWLDKDEYRIVRTEYYDNKGRLEKILLLKEYRLYLGQYWRAHQLLMENVETEKKTTLTFEPYQFRTGLGEEVFAPDSLKRIR